MKSIFHFTVLACLSFLLGLSFSQSALAQEFDCVPEQIVVINFDEVLPGGPLSAGAFVSNQYAPQGVMISAESVGLPAAEFPIVFDSSCPGGTCSGQDQDLGTPNEDFGGPGVGAGGEFGGAGPNTQALQNVLIIPEDIIDDDNDDHVDDPDDNANGGTITFAFSSPVEILSLSVVDIENQGNESVEVVGKKADNSNSFTTITVPPLGNNSFQQVGVPSHGLTTSTLELEFIDASGALGELRYCRELCIPDECGVCNGPGRDECGFCPEDPFYGQPKDDCEICPGEEGYENSKDECGVCFGNNSTCSDCLDLPNGTNVIDECGECVPPEEFNRGQDDCGVCFGENADKDICEVCFGDGSTCAGCAEVDTTQTLFLLDGLSLAQFRVVKRAVRKYRRLSGKKKALSKLIQGGEDLYEENWELIWARSTQVLTDCVNTFCTATNYIADLVDYQGNSDELSNLASKAIRKIKRKFGSSRFTRRLEKRRDKLNEEDDELLAELPAETFTCE